MNTATLRRLLGETTPRPWKDADIFYYVIAATERKDAALIIELVNNADELLAENERLRKALSDVADVILKIDWTQVALNHAEPCCHVDDSGKLCGRANKWAGHPSHHKFISLYIYTRAALEQKP